MPLPFRSALLVLLLLASAASGALAQTGVSGNTYVDADQGWVLSWNEEWTHHPRTDGTLQLGFGDSGTLLLIEQPSIGDPSECVAADVQERSANAPWFQVLSDAAGNPLASAGQGLALTAYAYHNTQDNAAYAVYVECRALAAGQSTLKLRYSERLPPGLPQVAARQLAQEQLNARALDVNTLLSRLVLPGWYLNPLAGYDFVWDPAVWAIVPPDPADELSGSGAAGVELTDGFGRLWVSPSVAFGGDPGACLAGLVEQLGLTPSVNNGQPIGGETAQGGVYGLYEVPPGTLFRGPARAYAECRELLPGAATLMAVYSAPIERFDAGSSATVAVLDSIVIVSTAQPAAPLDPRAPPPPPIDPRAPQLPPADPRATPPAVDAVATPAAAVGPPASPAAAAPALEPAIAVVEIEEIDTMGGLALGLSPDGKWLAVASDDDELCLHPVADSDLSVKCAALEDEWAADSNACRLVEANFAWSPDSQHLAFTGCSGGPFAFGPDADADIRVMATATGTLTNLTDDGYTGTIDCDRIPDETIWLDLFPAWSPDSKVLAFARTEFADACRTDIAWSAAVGTALYTVPLTGGEAQMVATVADEPFTVVSNPVWTPDGTRLLYPFVWGPDDAPDPRNGLWEVGIDGVNQRRLVVSTPETGNPLPLEVRPQGDLALIRFRGAPIMDSAALLDLVRGIVSPLLDLAGPAPFEMDASPEYAWVASATFSPDGEWILALEGWSFGQMYALTIRDVALASTSVLTTLESVDTPFRPRWTAGNDVFVRHPIGTGILLRLSTSRLEPGTPAATPAAT